MEETRMAENSNAEDTCSHAAGGTLYPILSMVVSVDVYVCMDIRAWGWWEYFDRWTWRCGVRYTLGARGPLCMAVALKTLIPFGSSLL